ncbi:hypothetical protein EVAR_57652_1 [Eumeta japonica]|uniref:Uncharacterized protein n=1 Tax=Eumeta variegata TaxID=151549 RepID=A0A4C1ZDG6_EUMVA|nr:hypothetical protein EVAR_57652_1 [Eumeta japonica]
MLELIGTTSPVPLPTSSPSPAGAPSGATPLFSEHYKAFLFSQYGHLIGADLIWAPAAPIKVNSYHDIPFGRRKSHETK